MDLVKITGIFSVEFAYILGCLVVLCGFWMIVYHSERKNRKNICQIYAF